MNKTTTTRLRDKGTNKFNVLIFVVDAMRASWIGCVGHSLVKTPHLAAHA